MSAAHELILAGDKDNFIAVMQSIADDVRRAQWLNTPSAAKEQQTPLHLAVKAGWLDIVPLMIRSGADPDKRDFYESSPLYSAVAARDHQAAEVLLSAGAKAETRTLTDGMTALHLAITQGDKDMVALLLHYGADIAARTPPNENGRNAFHYAATPSTHGIMDLLLKQPGAADNASAEAQEDGKSVTPLRMALAAGDRALAEKLLDFGVDVNERNGHGETPLFHLIAHRKDKEAALPLVDLLIRRGADVLKAKNFWDETPLFPAAQTSFTAAARRLIDEGVDAKQKDHYGKNALHYAAEKWDGEMIRLLAKHGAEINGADNVMKRTPLHIAAHANRLDTVIALLDLGADPFAKDKDGKTPRQLAPAPFQQRVAQLIARKEQELEIKKYGYDMYWQKKAAEPDEKPENKMSPRPQPRYSGRFRRGGRTGGSSRYRR